ncbi:MAG: T9SS type A sorting domain-containing protein, partial [Candidatus Delongbacteria bacterium]|nr:T9SS type A sorting domain-containing protein [Candidatus Delongbacteria bacterium]
FISSMAVDTEGRIFVGTRGHYDLGTGRIYRSENNGNTWEKVVYEYVFISDILINSDDEIFAGLVSGGVIYSKDHGDTWNYINEGLSGSGEIQDMAISPDGYIYLATDGGVYRSLNSTTGIESDNNLIFDFVLNQNYPNPFNSETAISFSISHDSDVVLSVFNIKGEFVENIFAGKLYKGLFNYSFKTDNLNSGIYFYSLAVNGKQVATKRMLYLK